MKLLLQLIQKIKPNDNSIIIMLKIIDFISLFTSKKTNLIPTEFQNTLMDLKYKSFLGVKIYCIALLLNRFEVI